MSRFVDSVIAYRILRLLVTPFEDTDAFKLGIIDKDGKELKKMSQLNTVTERDAYTVLHRMIFRIKKIIQKVPIENKKLVSFAAALALIKEHANDKYEPVDLESRFLNKLDATLTEEIEFIEDYFSKKNTLTFRQFWEDAPANNAAASPGVAGLTGEPPVSKKAQKRYKKLNLMFRR